MLLINVEKKNTIARRISSFKNVKKSDQSISQVISIFLKSKTPIYKTACKKVIKSMVAEKPKNFPRIKSCLLIGFERIRKIVFPSISLNKSWLHTNSTPISQNTSIIARPKSTIIFSHCPIVSWLNAREKIIKTKAKNKMRYKNLFLTISLKVFLAMFNMVWQID